MVGSIFLTCPPGPHNDHHCSDFNSVSERLPCCFSTDPPKQDFLDNYVTTFVGVCNFRNTSTMRVIFFLRMFQI